MITPAPPGVRGYRIQPWRFRRRFVISLVSGYLSLLLGVLFAVITYGLVETLYLRIAGDRFLASRDPHSRLANSMGCHTNVGVITLSSIHLLVRHRGSSNAMTLSIG